jgi:nitrate/nitrite transporter NarK
VQTSRRSRNVAMAGLMVAQSTHAILLGGMALFLPLISADLGLSVAEVGALGAVAAFTYAAAQVPAGLLTEVVGARRTFTIGLVGTNLAAIAFTLTSDVVVAVAVQLLSGLFRALLFTPGMLLATALFDSRRSATAAGLFVVGGVGSNLVLNLVGPVLVDHMSWQTVVTVMATPGVLLAFYLARFPVDAKPASSLRLSAFGELARSPAIRITWAIQFVRLFAFLGLGFWVPTYMTDRGHSLDLAGLAAALLALSTVPANIVGGYVSDRLDRPAAVIATCLTASAVSTALLSTVHSAALLLLLVATVGLSVQAYFGPLFTIAARYVPHASQALTTSTGNTWANVGGFVAVWALGLVRHETGSLEAGLLLISGLLAVAAVLAWVLGRLPTAAA